MLITEFGDAFKKIRHLHAHSHRLVPKQKIPFSFKYQITFSITWNFEILDTVLNAINKSTPENKRNTRFKLFIGEIISKNAVAEHWKLLLRKEGRIIDTFWTGNSANEKLSFASLKTVKFLFLFIIQFIHFDSFSQQFEANYHIGLDKLVLLLIYVRFIWIYLNIVLSCVFSSFPFLILYCTFLDSAN